MIRFCDLTNQINDDEKSFAFFDTVRDRFCEFSDSQVWSSTKDFIEDFNSSSQEIHKDVSRFLSLIPQDFLRESNF